MAHPLRVIVSGAMANKHLNGGAAWARLNWLLGLRRLGCEVHFVEQIRRDNCVDDAGAPAPVQESATQGSAATTPLEAPTPSGLRSNGRLSVNMRTKTA